MGLDTKTFYAKCEGLDIAYQVLGDGPVDVLKLNSAAVPIECMDDEPSLARFHRRLASFSRLIRFDRRGVGLSDRGSPSAPPTADQWVQDGLAVLDAVGSERAAVFASFASAPDGVLLAAGHPDRVSHLIIVNGAARAAWALDYPIGVPQGFLDKILGLVSEPDAVERGHDNLAMLAPSISDDAAFRSWWVRAGNLGATPSMSRAILGTQMGADVRHLLPRISVPTLILHRNATAVATEHGRYLAEHIPGAIYKELPGADAFYWVGDTGAMLDEIEEFLSGVRGGSGEERILATVLFTDIVASTERAAQLGDRRWRDLLDRHDHSVRTHLGRFRGREVNTVGDGFVATFDSPRRAIECAVALRQAMKSFDIEMRAGIHTGEIEVRGEDIAGLAVHIGARVSALAGPGEVLVSSAVPPLVAGSGIEFGDRGERQLKGVPGSWRIFAVAD